LTELMQFWSNDCIWW